MDQLSLCVPLIPVFLMDYNLNRKTEIKIFSDADDDHDDSKKGKGLKKKAVVDQMWPGILD